MAYIYFFFNSVLLPKGLLYTHILSPLFFYNTLRAGGKTWIKQFGVFLAGYDVIHLCLGVDLKSFLISNVLFILTYFCVVSFYHFVGHYAGLGKLFRNIVLVNLLLVTLAIPFFFFPKPYQQWFWYVNLLTRGVSNFPRLALFTYEASYYSLLLTPLVYYYVCKLLLDPHRSNKWTMGALVCVPMLLSFSFGVIGVTCVTAILLCYYFRRQIFRNEKTLLYVAGTVLVFCIGAFCLFYFFPGNFFAVRIRNVLAGADTSTKGRTIESFTMAWRIAGLKSLFFGAGLGQIKVMNVEVVHKYYNYWGVMPRYDIPNAMGETLAIFGIFGVILRIFLEVYLFIKTKVYSNYYRLALFIFIFIYQFTGSFITNIVEYVIWILAFSPVFFQFNRNDLQEKIKKDQTKQVL